MGPMGARNQWSPTVGFHKDVVERCLRYIWFKVKKSDHSTKRKMPILGALSNSLTIAYSQTEKIIYEFQADFSL